MSFTLRDDRPVRDSPPHVRHPSGWHAPSHSVTFDAAIRNVATDHLSDLRFMVHTAHNRRPREITPGEVTLPTLGSDAGWLAITVYGHTSQTACTTPFGVCTFPSISALFTGSGASLVAPVLRAGDDKFVSIGEIVLTSVGATPKKPSVPWKTLFSYPVSPGQYSAPHLSSEMEAFASMPVPYYGRGEHMVDTVVPLLAPFMSEDYAPRPDPNTVTLWTAILRSVSLRTARMKPLDYLNVSPTHVRQLLEDLIAVVALRGEFYPDQLWAVTGTSRLECDFYHNLFCHPDPTKAAGDCEDRAMAVLTVFDALTRVTVNGYTDDPDVVALGRVIEFARMLEAAAVDTLVRHVEGDPNSDLEKHMIVWLVPRDMMNDWARRGTLRGDVTAMAIPSRPPRGSTWLPRMPVMVETACEIAYETKHDSALPEPVVDQYPLVKLLSESHVAYVTLYTLADARNSVSRDANGDAVMVVRDLYSDTDTEFAGVRVPLDYSFEAMWSKMCTRNRTIRVSQSDVDLVPVGVLDNCVLEHIASRM